MSEFEGLETVSADLDPEQGNFESTPKEVATDNPSEMSAEQAVKATAEPEPAEKTAEKKEKKEPKEDHDKIQKRINKITREKYEALRDKEDLERKLARYEEAERAAEISRIDADVNAPKPEPDKFASEADYFEALGRWGTRQELAKEKKSQFEAKKSTQIEPDQKAIELEKAKDRIIESGLKAYPDDFEDVVLKNKNLPITPFMVESLSDDPNAADVFYYLAGKPEEAARIANLSQIPAVRELAKISARFLTSDESVTTKPKNIQPAPEPIVPIGTRTHIGKPPDKMTNQEYRELRKKQGVHVY